jgi:hypothetical protein
LIGLSTRSLGSDRIETDQGLDFEEILDFKYLPDSEYPLEEQLESMNELIDNEPLIREKYNIENGWKPVHRICIDVTLEDFWERFWDDGASFGMEEFFKQIKYYDVDSQHWKLDKGKQKRKMYCRIPINNVPICKYLDAKIVHEVVKTTPKILIIESDMKSTSQTFLKDSIQCKDCWVVKSPKKDSKRVIYSHYINL